MLLILRAKTPEEKEELKGQAEDIAYLKQQLPWPKYLEKIEQKHQEYVQKRDKYIISDKDTQLDDSMESNNVKRAFEELKGLTRPITEMSAMSAGAVEGANMKSTFKKKDRDEFLQECQLRGYIRKLIKVSHNELLEEQKLRGIIRMLLAEAKSSENEPPPHSSTGINVLEDLLKKVIPVIEDDYKKLTTDLDQRKSYRSHMINACKQSLMPSQLMGKGTAGEQEQNLGEGSLDEQGIDMNVGGDAGEEQDPSLPDMTPDEKSAFIDIDKKTDNQKRLFTIKGEDDTGRNMALKTYDKIEKNITDSYGILSNEEDEQLFYDYLLTNLKLYFDRFEKEMGSNVEEPVSPDYEEIKNKESEEDLSV